MARRKKHTRKHHKRSRRVGAVTGGITTSIGIIAGAVAGRFIAKKVLPNVDERIKNAGVVVAGAFLMPKVLKSELGKAIGNGMIASGGVGLLGSFIPAIAGTDDMISIPVNMGEVTDGLSLMAGDDDVMAGDDDVMAGDELSLMAGDDEY